MENKPTFPSPKRYDGFPVHSNGSSGYEDIFFGRKKMKFHIYVWIKFNGEIPPKHMIHHINEIKNDNRLENLELMTYADHNKLHGHWVRENGVWVKKQCNICKQILPLDQFYSGKRYSGACIECAKKQANDYGKAHRKEKWAQQKVWRKEHAEEYREYMLEYRKQYKEKNGEMLKRKATERYRRIRKVKKPRT